MHLIMTDSSTDDDCLSLSMNAMIWLCLERDISFSILPSPCDFSQIKHSKKLLRCFAFFFMADGVVSPSTYHLSKLRSTRCSLSSVEHFCYLIQQLTHILLKMPRLQVPAVIEILQ